MSEAIEMAAVSSIVGISTTNNQTEALITEIGLDKEFALRILHGYNERIIKAVELSETAQALVVTSVDDTEKMAEAREMLATYKDAKKEVESFREREKKESLRTGQFLDRSANCVKAFLDQHIGHLDAQAKFKINKEKAESEAKVAARTTRIAEITEDAHQYEAINLSDEDFDVFISKITKARDDAAELERLRIENAENERKAEEAIRARLQAENDKLNAERAAKDAELREAQSAAAAAQRVADEVKAEESRKAQAKAETAAKLAAASDKEKVEQFFVNLLAVSAPIIIDPHANDTLDNFLSEFRGLIDRTKAVL